MWTKQNPDCSPSPSFLAVLTRLVFSCFVLPCIVTGLSFCKTREAETGILSRSLHPLIYQLSFSDCLHNLCLFLSLPVSQSVFPFLSLSLPPLKIRRDKEHREDITTQDKKHNNITQDKTKQRRTRQHARQHSRQDKDKTGKKKERERDREKTKQSNRPDRRVVS
jgi:hypothetical protein